MPIRLTKHAADRMAESNLTREDVEAMIEAPDRVVRGLTADEYFGAVGGRPCRVVVVRGSEPALIITAHELTG